MITSLCTGPAQAPFCPLFFLWSCMHSHGLLMPSFVPLALPSLLVSALMYLTGKPTGFDHLDVPTSVFSSISVSPLLFPVLVRPTTVSPSPKLHSVGARFYAFQFIIMFAFEALSPIISPCTLCRSYWGVGGQTNTRLSFAPKPNSWPFLPALWLQGFTLQN